MNPRSSPPGRLATGKGWRLAAALLTCGAILAPARTVAVESASDTGGVEQQRTVRLLARLTGADKLPVTQPSAVARFQVVGGPHDGARFTLVYDYAYPIRLRTWGLHEAATDRQIGGGRVGEPAEGQWDRLVPPGSHAPVELVEIELLEVDLKRDARAAPERYFKTLRAVLPAGTAGRPVEPSAP